MSDGVSSGLVWTLGNLGGLGGPGIIGFTLDSPAVSFLILASVTLLALPLLARLRTSVAALPSSTQQPGTPVLEPSLRDL